VVHGAFAYSLEAHTRRHGPRGYSDWSPYKPWLRDEFCFRCVYCLMRERWYPSGHVAFGVDHLRPRAHAPDRASDYENLVYACQDCNALKGDARGVPDPCDSPYGAHLRIRQDGVIAGLSAVGQWLIDALRLNRATLLESRRRHIRLIDYLESRPADLTLKSLLREILSYPEVLPNLAALRPPAGNVRPNGIRDSFFERRRRGDLDQTY